MPMTRAEEREELRASIADEGTRASLAKTSAARLPSFLLPVKNTFVHIDLRPPEEPSSVPRASSCPAELARNWSFDEKSGRPVKEESSPGRLARIISHLVLPGVRRRTAPGAEEATEVEDEAPSSLLASPANARTLEEVEKYKEEDEGGSTGVSSCTTWTPPPSTLSTRKKRIPAFFTSPSSEEEEEEDEDLEQKEEEELVRASPVLGSKERPFGGLRWADLYDESEEERATTTPSTGTPEEAAEPNADPDQGNGGEEDEKEEDDVKSSSMMAAGTVVLPALLHEDRLETLGSAEKEGHEQAPPAEEDSLTKLSISCVDGQEHRQQTLQQQSQPQYTMAAAVQKNTLAATAAAEHGAGVSRSFEKISSSARTRGCSPGARPTTSRGAQGLMKQHGTSAVPTNLPMLAHIGNGGSAEVPRRRRERPRQQASHGRPLRRVQTAGDCLGGGRRDRCVRACAGAIAEGEALAAATTAMSVTRVKKNNFGSRTTRKATAQHGRRVVSATTTTTAAAYLCALRYDGAIGEVSAVVGTSMITIFRIEEDTPMTYAEHLPTGTVTA